MELDDATPEQRSELLRVNGMLVDLYERIGPRDPLWTDLTTLLDAALRNEAWLAALADLPDLEDSVC